MSWQDDLLQRYGQATRPGTGSPARVKRRLMAPEADPEVRALLRDLPAPRPGAEARVRRRLSSPAHSPARLWIPVAGLAAAVALVAFLLLPQTPRVPTQLSLDSADQLAFTTAHEHVALSYQGRGTALLADHSHDITWEQGTLRVEVTPDQGEEVVVTTPEAEVRVVGTVFEVTRDRLGTAVQVDRGQVEVKCGEQPALGLGAGSPVHTCLPTTPGGLLGRANALGEVGDWEEVLEACRAGLDMSPDPVFASALAELRVDAHHQRVARTLPDCTAALPHLRALVEAEALRADEAAWLAECERQASPASPPRAQAPGGR